MNIVFAVVLGISMSLAAQNQNCGFKNDCNCSKASLVESYNTADYIVTGTVVAIDTLSLQSVCTKTSIDTLKSDTAAYTKCAIEVLLNAKIIRAIVIVNTDIKNGFRGDTVFVCSPMKLSNCGYTNFKVGNRYIVFGSINQSADIYFLWSAPYDNRPEEFFHLEAKYKIWTNKCKRTMPFDQLELNRLLKLKNKL